MMEAASGKKRVQQHVIKRPAAAEQSDVAKKRPAACNSNIERYHGATIYTSESKEGFRVLPPGENRVDKLYKWKNYSSRGACLNAIKKEIDKAS